MATMIIRVLRPNMLGCSDEDVSGKMEKINKMRLGGPP